MIYTYGFNTFCIDEIGNKKDIIISRPADKRLTVYYRDKFSDVGFKGDLTERDLVLNNIEFENVDKNSLFEQFYQHLINERDKHLAQSKERNEISSKQIAEIKAVIVKQVEKQQELK